MQLSDLSVRRPGFAAVIAVLMKPGATALTVMPLSHSSTARDRVSPITPCLAAV